MRPISLEIEGFTSFRERVAIDFSSLDLFAITGPTGAGKTSIIDAMTYALYGCTPRIGEKQVSELISQGLNRTSVLFGFSSGKNEYRIARVGKWTGKQMNTEIRLEQCAGDEWVCLADGVQKAKPLIEQIVGLDFNGFTKSVVLPQGRFDEFLKGRADDRRKILSDLLDLAIYRQMMQRANALYNDHKAQVTAIADLLQKEYADATPARLAKLRQELEETAPQLEPVEAELKLLAKLLPVAHSLRQARKEFSKAEGELKEIGPKLKTVQNSLNLTQKGISDLERTLTAVAANLDRNTYDPSEHIRLSAMLDKARRLASVLAHFEQIEQARKERAAQIAKLDIEAKKVEATVREAAQACSDCRKDLERDRKALAKLQAKYGSPDAVQAAIEVQKQLAKQEKAHSKLEMELKSKEDERKRLDKNLASAESDAAAARDQRERARAEYDALIRRHSAESLRPGLRVGDPCPVCEQIVERLPKARKHQPVESAQQKRDDAENVSSVVDKRLAGLQAQVQPLERETASLRSRIVESAESIREHVDRLRLFGNADLALLKKELESAQRQADSSARRLEDLNGQSNSASMALKDHQHQRDLLQKDIDVNTRELETLQKESEKLRDQLGPRMNVKEWQEEVAKQEQAQSERKRLNSDRERLSEQLTKAKDDLAKVMANLEGLEATRKKVEETVGAQQSRIEEHSAALKAEFPHLKKVADERDEVFQLDQRYRDLQSIRDGIQKETVKLEGQIKSYESKIVRAAEMREQLEEHRTKMSVAKELHNALQGDEFIAFIQQEAYARLAADGSVHLKVLSADRYSFSVANDEFHVIDHWNADEPRPVTTLSGGESFLASLALALALAEGLSGLSSGHNKVALESLFLDEGFGTLDPETLEYVVAGIEGLSSNDRLIGMVSHIPELADRMPARIRVEKSVGGSSITIT